VHEITDGTKSDPKNLIRALTTDLGHHSDAAGIFLEGRIIEGGSTLMVGQGMVHGSGRLGWQVEERELMDENGRSSGLSQREPHIVIEVTPSRKQMAFQIGIFIFRKSRQSHLGTHPFTSIDFLSFMESR